MKLTKKYVANPITSLKSLLKKLNKSYERYIYSN